MSTKDKSNNISSTLFGKTRRAVLSLLYTHTDETFYLRQISRTAGAGLGAVQREVGQLFRAGIILRIGRGRNVYYQANPDCPVFEELKSLVVKTAGVGDVLRAAFTPLADHIKIALIYGSFARGEEKQNSDIDVLIIGTVTFAEIVSVLRQAQEKLSREINPTVYPSDEFQSKLAAGNHFLKMVLKENKIFLIGDERELTRLAQKRLAD